ncbi:MAG: Rrf2 family transcriptional regulator [Tissierellia bacterium]|nr:Rrf2 family transcriptional regulator [Tissierellia bacterium]
MKAEFNIAVQALCLLAEKGRLLNSEYIAREIDTNSVRVRNVLRKLSDKGYVEAIRGVKGGYRLQVDPKHISLGSLMDLIEVKPFKLRDGSRRGKASMEDISKKIYQKINQAAYRELDKISLYEVQQELFSE